MILIIGGEASGKRSYARSLGYSDSDMSDSLPGPCPVLCNLQELAAATPNIESMLPELLKKKLILCNEVGSGVIPMERERREARERAGRLCILLSGHAEHVIRMVCGIPTVLK